MENKKKKNKKKTAKKTNVKKNVDRKVNTPSKKNTPTKKATPVKKEVPKKETPKKVEVKEEIKKVVEEPKEEIKKVVEEPKEEKLEKTIIFDGKQNKNLKEVVEKLEEEKVVVDDKVFKRSKAKRIAIVILIILMVVVITAASAYVITEKKTEKKNHQTVSSNIYEKVLSNNKNGKLDETREIEEPENTNDGEEYENIHTISLSQFEQKVLEKEDMVVLVASSTCYGCITFEPIINEVFTEMNKIIYRIDIMNLTENEVKRFREYYSFTVTPTLFVIKDGVVVADTAETGTMEKEALQEWIDRNI